MPRGGARVGAGRKPKALVYASDIAAAEATIAESLPKLIGKLMELAEEGNVAALRYLVDRILGRVAILKAAPATDTSMQYVESDFQRDLMDHLLRSTQAQRSQESRMAEMDLEGTELEYEIDDDVDEGREEASLTSDIQDGQDGEENVDMTVSLEKGGDQTASMAGRGDEDEEEEEFSIDGQEEEENVNMTVSLERRGDQTASMAGRGDEDEEEEEFSIDGQEGAENVNMTVSLEKRGDQTASMAGHGDRDVASEEERPAEAAPEKRDWNRIGMLPPSGRIRLPGWQANGKVNIGGTG